MTMRRLKRSGRSLVRGVFRAARRGPRRGGPGWGGARRGRRRRAARARLDAERLECRLPLSANSPPTATITLLPPADGQAGDTVRWAVAFSEAVTGVDRGDFQLAAAGGVTIAAAQVSVAGSASAYTVTATGVRGVGTVGLNLVDDGSIRDASNTPLRATTAAGFASLSTMRVGRAPTSREGLKAADVTGDGFLDLIVTNQSTDEIQIYRGSGTGLFSWHTSIKRPSVGAIEAVDLDRDNDVDLVVTSPFYKSVTVLLNPGNGGFRSFSTYTVQEGPRSVRVADFNGDGILDIATGSSGLYPADPHRVSVLRGNGDGTFQQPRQDLVPPSTIDAIVTGDFNGDGRQDIVASNASVSSLSLFAGAPGGGFAAPTSIRIGAGLPGALVASDIDGDGDLDIAVIERNTAVVSVLTGNGNGTFGQRRAVPTGGQAQSLDLRDVTGDGRLDLIVTLPNANRVAVLAGRGDGSFGSPLQLATPAVPGSLAIGDFNRDGRPDIAVTAAGAGLVGGEMRVFRNAVKGNVSGEMAAVAVTVPQAPTNLVAIRGDRQVTLSWDAPASNGGSALTGYLVETSDNGGSTWQSTPRTLADGRQFTVTGLSNGTGYLFRVAAVNGVGTGASVTSETARPAGFPSAPLALDGTVGDASVSLSWTAPADTGGEITNYVVEYRAASGTGSGAWTVASRSPSAQPSAAVTGLVNGREYLFRVAAVNAQGQGDYVTATTPLVPQTTPGLVTGLAAVAGDRFIDISWSPLPVAANGGRPLVYYVVEFKPAAASVWTGQEVAAPTTSLRVFVPTNGESYVYRVAARNAVGTGSFADGPSTVVPFEPAAAPTIESTTAGSGQVSLSWSLPSSDGGREITDYAIEYRPATAEVWIPFSRPATTDRTAIVTGLANGTAYQFRVAAVTAAGTGTRSASGEAMPFGVPTMSGLSTHEVDGAVQLAWLPARPNGRPVTHYVVEYRPSEPADGVWLSAGMPGEGASMNGVLNTLTVRGLANGTRYQFRVAAVNAVGASGFALSDTVMPNVTPLAPTNLTATPLNRAVALAWNAPAPNGGTAVTRYMISFRLVGATQWSTVDSAPITTTSATVDRLVNGLSYDFEVRAVNARGPGAAATLATPVTPVVAAAPRVLGVAVQGTPAFGASEVSWDVTFSAPVTGVDAADFTAVTRGLTKVGSLSVTGGGAAYVVRATGITGAGSVGLNLVDNGSIRDVLGTRLSRSGETVFQETSAAMGSLPMGLAVADLNADGRPDLVTANDANGTVSVRLALSNGGYATAVNYKTYTFFASAAGVNSRAVAVANLNDDQLPDIVVANRGSNTVSVLWGTGAGKFKLQHELFAGSTPSAVAVGDFSGDGLPDIAVANAMAGTVSILPGTRNGGFQSRLTVTVGGAPTSLAVADLNQDGWQDIVVGGAGGSPVSVLLGSRSLTFQAPRTVAAGVSPEGVVLADVTRDGKLDLVVANRTAATVSVIAGNGNGTFASPVAYAVDPNPAAVTVADIDGDAWPDLVVVSPFGQAASVLLADGTGGFLARRTLTTGGFPLAAAATDLNGDGRTDLAVLDQYAQGVKLFTNGLNGTTTGGVAALAPLPAAPTLTSATGGNGSATLAWTAGSDGGLSITNYVIQRRSGGGEWADVTRPVSVSTTATITGLANGATYEFRVAAVTVIGTGDFSPASAVTPAPVAPGYVFPQSVVPGNGQATVSWVTPADDGGSPITNYVVQYRTGPADWTTFVRDPSTATSAVVTGLTNGATYVFRFAAVNAVGTGEFSVPALVVTPCTLPDGLSSAPVATSGNASATLTWGAPLFDGGTPITNYRIESSTDGGENWTLVLRPASSSNGAVLTGLNNGTSYLFRVTPVNGVGAGPSSVTAVAVVPAPVAPAAPGTLLVTAAEESAIATWAAPVTDGGSPITGYAIEYTTDGGATWTTAPGVGAAARATTVTGLAGGRSHIFRVAAVNEIGTGQFATAAPVTPFKDAHPSVTAIGLAGPAGPGATTVTWNVTFSEPVTGVDTTDFQFARVGSVNASFSVAVSGSGAVYTVTASGVTGTGTLGLNLVDNDSIRDSSGKRLMNRGAPVFQAGQYIDAEGIFVTGDFDRDGRMDFVSATYHGAFIWRGNGDGTFQSQVNVGQANLFAGFACLRSADVNGDGKLDLVFARYQHTGTNGFQTAGQTVAILPGNGNGTFGTAQFVTVGYYPIEVLLTDLNKDGRLDLVAANAGGDDGVYPGDSFYGSYDTVSVRLNDGGSGFLPETKLELPKGTFGVYMADQLVAGDFNRDGTVDIIAGQYLFERKADGSFEERKTVAGPQYMTNIDVGDVNGDGWLDLVTSDSDGLRVISGSAAGFTTSVLIDTIGYTDFDSFYVDFDGDGTRDIISGGKIWRGLGGGTFANPESLGVVPSPQRLVDLNDDGRLDLLGRWTFLGPGVQLNAAKGTFTGERAVLTTAPAAPRSLSAARGDASANLSWTAPETSGSSAITSYAIEQSTNGGATWTTATVTRVSDTATTATVTGLTNGTVYVFRVAAVNSAGTGAFTSGSSPVLVATVPSQPAFKSWTPGGPSWQGDPPVVAGNATAYMFWIRPGLSGGAMVTDYEIQYSSDNGVTWQTWSHAPSVLSSATVTGLQNGTTYVFRVAAINAVGRSDFSATSIAVTPATLADAPAGVSADASAGQVIVSWMAPAWNGGSAVTGYQVQRSSDGGATWVALASLDSSQSSVTDAKVALRTTYRYRVAAVNAVGVGAFAESAGVLPATEPVVTGIELVGPASTVADRISWAVTFSEPVTGVDPNDFRVAGSGVTATALEVVGSGAVYTVTAVGLVGTGSIGLNLVDDGTIRNSAGSQLWSSTGTIVSYASPQAYATGSGAQSIVRADFNGDGIGDLAFANTTSKTVGVMLGNADGTFRPQTSYTVVQASPSFVHTPYAVRAGDLNGDGFLDLAIGTRNQWWAVMNGVGDGTFLAPQFYSTGTSASVLANIVSIADLNRDGRSDMLFSHSGSVWYRLANSTGGFNSASTTAALPSNVSSFHTVDLNADGFLDIVSVGSGSVCVAMWSPSEGFPRSRPVITLSGPLSSVAFADLNGDGKPDLVAGAVNSVLVLLGGGDGSFQTARSYAAGSSPAPVVADFNGDGRIDIVVAHGSGSTMGVLAGRGDGTFLDLQTWSVGSLLSSPVVGDVNGDGVPDLITLSSSGNTVVVQVGVRVGSFTGQVATRTNP